MFVCTVAMYRLMDIFCGLMLFITGLITLINIGLFVPVTFPPGGKPHLIKPFAHVYDKIDCNKGPSHNLCCDHPPCGAGFQFRNYGMRNIYWTIACVGAIDLFGGLIFFLCAIAVIPWPNMLYNYHNRGVTLLCWGFTTLGLCGGLGFWTGIFLLIYSAFLILQGAPYLITRQPQPQRDISRDPVPKA